MSGGFVRVGDQVIGFGSHGADCCGHNIQGVWTSGSPNTIVNGRPLVRVGDTGVTNCPHCGTMTAMSGMPSVIVNGRQAHLMGGTVMFPCGQGTTISCSGDSI
ncbi:PAAR domain-containing protein [Yersinia ruckeri]|uniref:PAAR domain-containing protein n=1 Tax=Yersinia ruckeri TaxID=29486 RepID=UPI003B75C2B3